MKDNKYYVPTIEEFHIGFQYEFKPRIREGIMSYAYQKFNYIDRWKKQSVGKEANNILDLLDTYNDPFSINDLISFHRDNAVRVKYLDEEDIESLGWIMDSIYSFIKGDWMIEVNINELIDRKDTLDIYLVSDCRFKGYIKNKSELKRLMDQLGINKK